MNRHQDIETDIVSFCRIAKEMGASHVVPLPAEDIVVDERCWLKCLVPLCPHYDRDLLCPPNVLPASQFRELLKRYRSALLVKIDIPSPSGEGEPGNGPFKSSKMKLYEIIGRLEALCLEKGHYFAAGLVAGSCDLCEQCVGISSGLSCRYPLKARPSMEALGIDVFATAQKAGLSLSFAREASRSWVGLLLVC